MISSSVEIMGLSFAQLMEVTKEMCMLCGQICVLVKDDSVNWLYLVSTALKYIEKGKSMESTIRPAQEYLFRKREKIVWI